MQVWDLLRYFLGMYPVWFVCVLFPKKKKNSPSCFYMLISLRVSPWILLMVSDILSYSSACNPLLPDIHGSVVPLKCLQAVTHRCLLQLPAWGPNHTNVFCLISKSDETEISSLGSPQIALLSWRRGWNSGCVLLTVPCYSREWVGHRWAKSWNVPPFWMSFSWLDVPLFA